MDKLYTWLYLLLQEGVSKIVGGAAVLEEDSALSHCLQGGSSTGTEEWGEEASKCGSTPLRTSAS